VKGICFSKRPRHRLPYHTHVALGTMKTIPDTNKQTHTHTHTHTHTILSNNIHDRGLWSSFSEKRNILLEMLCYSVTIEVIVRVSHKQGESLSALRKTISINSISRSDIPVVYIRTTVDQWSRNSSKKTQLYLYVQ